MRVLLSGAAALLLILCQQVSAAEKAAADAKPIVDQNFASSVAPGWRVAKGDWKIVDGAWQGAELPADKHGAVARMNLEYTDAVFDFDFKLDGARGISLSLNDAKGHVARVAIRPNGFSVIKDDHDHDGPDKRHVFADVDIEFRPGTWYHARVEVKGDYIWAQIGDDRFKTGGHHPLFANVKANFGFTVAGQSASFKNLRVTAPVKN